LSLQIEDLVSLVGLAGLVDLGLMVLVLEVVRVVGLVGLGPVDLVALDLVDLVGLVGLGRVDLVDLLEALLDGEVGLEVNPLVGIGLEGRGWGRLVVLRALVGNYLVVGLVDQIGLVGLDLLVVVLQALEDLVVYQIVLVGEIDLEGHGSGLLVVLEGNFLVHLVLEGSLPVVDMDLEGIALVLV
jgi:hypothetical protein